MITTAVSGLAARTASSTLQARQVRHPLVGEHQVEGLLLEARHGVPPAGRLDDVEALLPEEAAHELALGRLVVDHQDPERLSH